MMMRKGVAAAAAARTVLSEESSLSYPPTRGIRYPYLVPDWYKLDGKSIHGKIHINLKHVDKFGGSRTLTT